MKTHHHWVVSPKDQGITVVDFLQKKLKQYSKKAIKAAIDRKGCLVNNNYCLKSTTKLKPKDQVVFNTHKTKSIDKLPILYEDEWIMVVNKPAFLECSLRSVGIFYPHLEQYPLIHRLDKETTGCWMVAKSLEGQKAMMKLFKERSVNKTYLLLAKKDQKKKVQHKGLIDAPIKVLSKHMNQKTMGIGAKGQEAVTRYIIRKNLGSVLLIEASPKTGRTHQIRVHMPVAGLKILGDEVYGEPDARAPRVMLHAFKLSFTHPFTKMPINITARRPKDFSAFLTR